MRIGVISDTHGHVGYALAAIELLRDEMGVRPSVTEAIVGKKHVIGVAEPELKAEANGKGVVKEAVSVDPVG